MPSTEIVLQVAAKALPLPYRMVPPRKADCETVGTVPPAGIASHSLRRGQPVEQRAEARIVGHALPRGIAGDGQLALPPHIETAEQRVGGRLLALHVGLRQLGHEVEQRGAPREQQAVQVETLEQPTNRSR